MPPTDFPFDLYDHDDWREAVKAWLAESDRRSLSWLCRATGYAKGHLSPVLSTEHRRSPPEDLHLHLARLMALDPQAARFLRGLMDLDAAMILAAAPDTDEQVRQAQVDQVAHLRRDLEVLRVLHRIERDAQGDTDLLTRWQAMVLQETFACSGMPDDPASLAARMVPPGDPAEVARTLAWLVEHGHLAHRKGRYLALGPDVQWYTAETGQADRRRILAAAHRKALALYAQGLELVPREERLYKLAFQAIPVDLLPELSQRVDELLAWVHREATARDDAEGVYVLGFVAVPALRRAEAPDEGRPDARGDARQDDGAAGRSDDHDVGSAPTR